MADRPGGEPTEEPTPRRVRDARRKGQVAYSRDLTASIATLAALAALGFGGMRGIQELRRFLLDVLHAIATPSLDDATLAPLAHDALHAARVLLAPILIAALVAGALAGGLQTAGLITLKPLELDLSRINPGDGLRRLFSLRALGRLGRGLLVATMIVLVSGVLVADRIRDILAVGRGTLRAGESLAAEIIRSLFLRGALVLFAAGALDYLLSRRRLARDLRMTREEVRREAKEDEGDPHHKHARRRMHEELLREETIHAVRRADCVIVNPDHIAVAVRFDRSSMSAPVIVAKGERLQAEEIKRIAKEAGVPILRDVPLARALVELEPGEEIPEALYDAVAELLRFVYRLGGRSPDVEGGAR